MRQVVDGIRDAYLFTASQPYTELQFANRSGLISTADLSDEKNTRSAHSQNVDSINSLIVRHQARNMKAKTSVRKPWTPTDVRTLRTLAKQKKPVAAIARTLKRSVQAIYIRGSLLKIRFKRAS